MREYDRRQNENRQILSRRRAEIRDALPQISRLDEEIARQSADAARRMLLSPDAPADDLPAKLSALERQKEQILTENGYPADYLTLPCTCPICKDTGFTDGQKCVCFRQAEINLLFAQSGIRFLPEEDSFDRFSLDFYPDDVTNPATGLTARETAGAALQQAKDFVRDFDTSPGQNLFLYGDTGVGKTFLSRCIAQALLENTRSVIYFSAHDLFRHLARQTFSEEPARDHTDPVPECDLLIIDDLGTELTNAFVSSSLFTCINDRMRDRRSTIISTNLSLQEFSDTYSERTFSRIVSDYTLIKLIGGDIRLLKKHPGGK